MISEVGGCHRMMDPVDACRAANYGGAMGDTSIAAEKYVSLTTFKKDGTPRPAPVWISDLGDGTMGFTTASSSWKVKRLSSCSRATPEAT